MGDRITTVHPCPLCGQEMETYDASSCLLYTSSCDSCGYKDPREYFEIGEHTIALITSKELEELKEKDPEVKAFRNKVDNIEENWLD